MILDELRMIGLTKNEVTIYLLLVRIEEKSADEISFITGINRTTVYSVCKELMKKELLTVSRKGSCARFKSEHPFVLEKIFEKEFNLIQAKKSALKRVIEHLSKSNCEKCFATKI